MNIRQFILCISLLSCLESHSHSSPLRGFSVGIDSMLAERSLSISRKEVGQLETSKNHSPRIKDYLLSIGIDYPANYCAAGIYWSFEEARKELVSLGYNHINPLPKTGVANSIYNWAKEKGDPYYGVAAIGDMLIWRKPRSWQGHIERIVSFSDLKLRTIGFNTRKAGKEGVFYKIRMPRHPLGRLKYRGIIHIRKITDIKGRYKWK